MHQGGTFPCAEPPATALAPTTTKDMGSADTALSAKVSACV